MFTAISIQLGFECGWCIILQVSRIQILFVNILSFDHNKANFEIDYDWFELFYCYEIITELLTQIHGSVILSVGRKQIGAF